MTMQFTDAASCWQAILSDVVKNRGLLDQIERFARENTAPAEIVFGTSGWRGEIGTDYTFNNVRIVTTAIIEVLQSRDPEVVKAIGVPDFEEIKKRGVIVGHDNRFLGREFAREVMGLLQQAGMKTWYAGEAPTPEFSSGIEMLKAACSINLTPSHNPANYAGFKFNPADGGPAGSEITTKIEEISNRMMREQAILSGARPTAPETIDLPALYLQYIQEKKTLDLGRILAFIKSSDCAVCIDNVHGSTRGRIERILGASRKITYLRTADDQLFGGIAPEPSEKNMAGTEQTLQAMTAALKLGVIMDPDGDRIRFCDGNVQIPMNYFGAMALHFLHVHKGFSGVVAKSVGTSNLVNAIAKKLGIAVRETKVGFKNFRPYMVADAPERAIVVFEESDGISGYHHTLEKDALFGLLLALEMMAVTGKKLGDYLTDLMEEFGYYYPDRSGISVDKALVGEPLLRKLSVLREQYKIGTEVVINSCVRTVRDLITVDGTKLVFDDGSWLMIRPSGTEPKVRFYIEARTEEGKKAVFETAERMTREALAAPCPA
ncbi:MAG: phosphomannomutase [Thermodesulfovibrio sp.]|nr:phosphomannomutase [Thermodesulfovibrio sp.]